MRGGGGGGGSIVFLVWVMDIFMHDDTDELTIMWLHRLQVATTSTGSVRVCTSVHNAMGRWLSVSAYVCAVWYFQGSR